MKKRKIRRRNPVARALRRIRPPVVPSAKAYRRKPKHKGHSEINRNDLFLFFGHTPPRSEIQNRDGLSLFLCLDSGIIQPPAAAS